MFSYTVLVQRGITFIPNSFPAKTVLVRERVETFANFAPSSAQIGPYWSIWPLSERFAPFYYHVQLAAINITRKRTDLYFRYANAKKQLPINPLGLTVNGSYFSYENVFSI